MQLASQNPQILLVGNPNVGKTLLFNRLTGLKHKVANYPGVTVEVGQGSRELPVTGNVTIIDLPGVYSLAPQSADEEVALDKVFGAFATSDPKKLVVAVVDATHLDRHLFLVSQLLERQLPLVVAITMVDAAEKEGIHVDLPLLRKKLGVPVVALSGKTGRGIPELLVCLDEHLSTYAIEPSQPPKNGCIPSGCEEILRHYQNVEGCLNGVVRHEESKSKSITEQIDRWLLHPVAGFAFLFLVFGVMFQTLFSGAQPIADAIDGIQASAAIAIKNAFSSTPLFASLLGDGIIAGLGSVFAFVPLIFILFLFLGFLEDSGYLARATFLLDRVMAKFGLPAKALMPLVSGFACAVPAILATRVISSRKERMLTIMVTPLMSCSARLPIYGLLIATFFSKMPPFFGFIKVGALVMFGLYATNLVMVFLMAWLFSKFIFKGESSSFIMELPPYRLPRFSSLMVNVWGRVKVFLREAGTLILAMTVIMWALFTFPRADQDMNKRTQLEQSYAGKLGKLIEPVIKPLGFDWKIGVGIVSSFTAREVAVSTLGVVYNLGEDTDENSSSLRSALLADKDPISGKPIFTPLVALSLMVFFALSMQCMSTLAVTRKETKSIKWPIFQFSYMTLLAWICSFAVYQGGVLMGFA